jgi:methyl-accepting chemotaxis protein
MIVSANCRRLQRGIGDVVELINTAGQTNLLALNATIVAARAGEELACAGSERGLTWNI